ncbi:MAG: Hsp20/alpha crystallin family protein [Acidobacteriota bacterium]|nr:Hsp20/alpha crystallin family protein [Acidobacteriota bacterium]
MPIVKWDPFRGILSSREGFNQFFNDALSNFINSEAVTPKGWTPAVDIYETDHNLVLKSELPGIDPKDVEVRIEDNTLYLKGERRQEKEAKEENYHRVERSYGSFLRTFTLPNSVDTENVKAEYKDGVLTLTLAKREEAKPKTIKINVATATQVAAASK